MQMAMVWTTFNDLRQDCQGLWNCWRNGQWCSNWFGGWICAGACQLGGYWRTWCSSFSKQTGSSTCRQLFSSQQDSTHTEVSSLQEARGWMVSLHKNLFLRNSLKGRERKLDGAANTVGRLCAHLVCLHPFMPANFKGQAGRSQGLHNRVCEPKFRSPRCCVLCSQNRNSADNLYGTAGFQILYQTTRESSVRLKISK
jgi:hypothetical protein